MAAALMLSDLKVGSGKWRVAAAIADTQELAEHA